MSANSQTVELDTLRSICLEPPARRPPIEALTGVRGLAALWVLALHLTVVVSALLPKPAEQMFSFFAKAGFLGVDVFFVLSGFVIAYNYAELFQSKPTAMAFGRFLQARLARIYPVHFTCLTGLVVTIFILGKELNHDVSANRWSSRGLIESLLLIQAWTGNTNVWNSVAWSISCEWFAYLLFPWLVPAVRRIGERMHPGWIAILLTTLLLVPVAHTKIYPGLPGALLLHVASTFFAGCVLHELFRRDAGRDAIALSPDWLVPALLIAASLLVRMGEGIAYFTVPLIAPMLLALAYGRGLLSDVLSHPLMTYLGRISFSLYMTHYLWLWLMHFVFPLNVWSQASAQGRWFLAGAHVVPVFAIAALTYHLIEEPARNFLQPRRR